MGIDSLGIWVALGEVLADTLPSSSGHLLEKEIKQLDMEVTFQSDGCTPK